MTQLMVVLRGCVFLRTLLSRIIYLLNTNVENIETINEPVTYARIG